MMWKDFMYFSRNQRMGVITLLLLCLLAMGGLYLMPLFFTSQPDSSPAFKTEVKQFCRSLVSRDSLRQLEWERKRALLQSQYDEKYRMQEFHSVQFPVRVSLFVFDPNRIDSASFVRLGIHPHIASNILRYRSKGGRFRTSADFAKVWGISALKFKELEPYISIIADESVSRVAVTEKRTDIVVELNSADTTLLMKIKGIGAFTAKNIVRFRQQSGGFVSVEQLADVYGMKPEMVEKLRPCFRVDLSLVQKLNVNIASVERLRRHPYLNFYKAKAIYELRRYKGKLKSMSDLSDLPELTSDDIRKVTPYLSFD